MRRLVDSYLDAWRVHPRRKPMIVRGARQVGKTHSLLEFGKRSFGSILHVDFERNPELVHIFQKNLAPGRLTRELEIASGVRLIPGETLLILDEVQACPQAITALRYFKEEMPEVHVFAAGSLLEFALRDLSFPVGRIQFLEMFPMTFAEYLWALGNEEGARVVLDGPGAEGQVGHAYLVDALKQYLVVGGMPEAVSVFASTGSFLECGEVHRSIYEAYRADFAKYAPGADKECLRSVLVSTARMVGQQLKYSRLATGYSNATIHRAFDLLHLARLVRKVRSTSPAGLPLDAHASNKVFKAVFVDVGLMQHICGIRMDVEYLASDLLDIHRGAVAEQFAGQEFAAATGGELHYWSRPKRGSSAEVDYLLALGADVVPVEIKSGATGRFRSLKMLLGDFANVNRALVFSSAGEITTEQLGIVRLPLYYAYFAARGQLPAP